jgi:hypothetical protein
LLLKRRKHKKLMFNLGVGSIAVVAVGGLIAFAVMATKGDAGATTAAPKAAADIDLFDGVKTPAAPANAVTSPTAAAVDKPLEPWRGEVKWVDAAKEPIRRGDVEVRVVQAGPGRPALFAERGAARRTFKNDVLLIKLGLKNVGGKPQADYAPWSMRTGGVSMRDNVGRIIRMASVRDRGLFAEGQQEAATVPIEDSVEDLLVFQLPVEKFRSLRLELSGVALGQAEPLGFEIPVGMLRAFEPSGRTGSDEIDEENPGASVDRGLGGVEDKPAAPAAPAKPPGIPGVTEHDPFDNGSM